MQRLVVHPAEHQHLAGVVLLGDGGDQAVGAALEPGGDRGVEVGLAGRLRSCPPFCRAAVGRRRGRMGARDVDDCSDIPDLTGRTAVVDRGQLRHRLRARRSSWPGTARTSSLAARDPAAAPRPGRGCGPRCPAADVELGRLDLADLASVRAFAVRLRPATARPAGQQRRA